MIEVPHEGGARGCLLDTMIEASQAPWKPGEGGRRKGKASNRGSRKKKKKKIMKNKLKFCELIKGKRESESGKKGNMGGINSLKKTSRLSNRRGNGRKVLKPTPQPSSLPCSDLLGKNPSSRRNRLLSLMKEPQGGKIFCVIAMGST